jgi:rubrerythrin
MSLMWTLRKWIDPEYRRDEEERRRLRETLMPEEPGGPGDDPPIREVPAKHAHFHCRVCGHRGNEPEFCPRCLAGTMQPD